MNKLSVFSVVGILAFFVAIPVYAATITLSPTTVSVKKGQTVSLAIYADPTGSKLYTVKSSISFPAPLLEAVSFTQSGGWVPLSMAGYDSIDNANGLVVKTAGYPAGFLNNTVFGTLSFRAKESGTATISITGASAAYDAQNKNAISGTQGVAFVTITTPVAVSVPAKSVSNAPKITESPLAEPVNKESAPAIPVDSDPIITQESEANPSLLASVSSIMTLGTDSLVIGITVGIVLLAIICYLIYALG